ncbi:ParB/RepB/Spo0J family partition protein [Burkholderia metallica]|uniref:ParB/RepB/Spo0J family partition protein n=1 Tax=Burkholderia metallica TaxID=488729 RepID=UPI001CF439D8|nr:ParB/RepB/Spo0J family partition protein [Burkholderia metallica]MCA8021974.1 ParB/RepB/Spo0J family partition protein [Burkholderia metallica]
MSYVTKLTAPAERETLIKKAVDCSDRKEAFYDFRSTKHDLPIIRVGIDLPVYRMENFRTYTDQHEYIAKEKKNANFFATGQEIESVQQIQHELLTKLAKKGVADSVVPVIDVLQKEGQREPILITALGVVVNGNRRLAALRELSKTHVDAMVLPADASADEIVDIEASLQGRPETKLDYDWIGDGQLIARLIGMSRSPKQVADQLRRSEKDIKNSLQALSEADLYLKEWAHAEGEYRRITDDAEQFFKDLPKRLEGKDAAAAQASRVIAWSLFDNRDKLPGRIYDFNPAFGKLSEDVLDRVASDLGLSESPLKNASDNQQLDDDFSIDFDADDEATLYDSVIDALKDESTRDEAVEALIEAALNAIETEKGQKSGEAALKSLSQANGKIAAVDLSKAAPETYSKIRKQLETIESLCESLRLKLDNLE